MPAEMLEVEDLTIDFRSRRGTARVVDRVSLTVGAGEIVGLIGESGSGKTMTALSVLGLLPRGAQVTGGDIRLDGDSLIGLSEARLREIRGNRVSLIPQDALRALNPVHRIARQVGEPHVIHRGADWAAAEAQAVDQLANVHLRDPAVRAQEFPHQFSGGMQQRAMIAMGLALEPELLIADEPTTALDVTVQAQVLALLREIRDNHGAAILFITHDLGVVAQLCDRVYVIYAGSIVEAGPVRAIFAEPGHPYTQALLEATPTVSRVQDELVSIRGQIPSPFTLPPGCRFADRCQRRHDRCTAEPAWFPLRDGHAARCWLRDPADV